VVRQYTNTNILVSDYEIQFLSITGHISWTQRKTALDNTSDSNTVKTIKLLIEAGSPIYF